MRRTKKPVVYTEREMLKALKALGMLKKHIDNSKRLNKTNIRDLVEDIQEPLMRAFGYIFPDEELDDDCPKCDGKIIDNNCNKCKYTYNLDNIHTC